MASLDQMNLAIFPTTDKIEVASRQAADKCNSLISLLGLVPRQVLSYATTGIGSHPVIPCIPSIGSWFKTPINLGRSVDDDTESLYSEYDNESISEAQQLQDILNKEEDLTLQQTKAQETEIAHLTCAVIAVTTDEITKVYVQLCHLVSSSC